jgi:hypothetical protein
VPDVQNKIIGFLKRRATMEWYESNDVQIKIQDSINCLVGEFVQNPFVFFNEADAVSDLICKLKANIPQLENHFKCIFKNSTVDTTLLHREYPASCFFKEGKKLEHFDLVILNPKYVEINEAESLARPNGDTREVKVNPFPFIAAIEFKLLYEGISNGRIENIKSDVRRLDERIKKDQCKQTYFIYLQRILKNYNKAFKAIKELRENDFVNCKNVKICNVVFWSSEEGKPGDFNKVYKNY